MPPRVVVGVDGCKDGWIAIALTDDGAVAAHFLRGIAEVEGVASGIAGIAIDIPIGVPDAGPRACDTTARDALGRRRGSLFLTPVRAALAAPTYVLANRAAIGAGESGISRQAWGLRTKILEVDAWLPQSTVPVWEVHPELSFTVLMGALAQFSKKTWAGLEQRRSALAAAGIHLEGLDDAAGSSAAPDDVLDAAVCAWSARRLVNGQAVSYPADPPLGPGDRPIAIWA